MNNQKGKKTKSEGYQGKAVIYTYTRKGKKYWSRTGIESPKCAVHIAGGGVRAVDDISARRLSSVCIANGIACGCCCRYNYLSHLSS